MMIGTRTRRLAAITSVLCIVAGSHGMAQESASFKIRSLSVSALAETAASSSFHSTMTVTVVQGATGVCPAGPSVTLGFFSVLGAQAVPIVLRADKNPGQPGSVDLSWTGQADGFVVYRAPSPEAVAEPHNELTTTQSCSTTDSTADDGSVLFYLVEPNAPRPTSSGPGG